MQNSARIFVLLVLLAGLFVGSLRHAYACQCWDTQAPPDALASADAVFAGRVLEIAATAVGPNPDPAAPLRTTFQVNQVWKGAVAPTLSVVSNPAGPTCGYDFTQGRIYIVYAGTVNGEPYTSACYRTNLLADAQADIAALGAGQMVTNPASASLWEQWLIPAGAAGLLLMLAIVGAGVVVFRKKEMK